MKKIVLLILMTWSVTAISQEKLEIVGKVKITEMDPSDSDSIVVWNSDGTLARREASTLSELQVLSISNDTIYLSGGDFVKLPAEVDGDVTNEKITGFGIIGDSLFIKEGSMDTMKVKIGFSSSETTYEIGDLAHGGIVFFINANGTHGLVAANMDQHGFVNWYRAHDELNNPSKHDVEGKKYFDWRLPSKWELNEMWKNLYRNGCPLDNTACTTSLGGFSGNVYWGSTEDDFYDAWVQSFLGGYPGTSNKDLSNNVRAVRAF